ncbi:hypothetical protein EMIHUDRAFT_454384 [Emiliania huxleyi CCMP1516]|uniref:Uncharacterized protein n=2 Tax=Emiliania huxleyi TaxID=2903 RepID=A0A0D3KVI8_EMIH1|nr:hypothetical protein EMIHUDRAFT_454384 [Emiliania huxleyi CCMP1516]EOD39773.1 hypothetical protein EMIHUDRAFT_454384 [Emiliania huxleyi CCMP1516]|eukprot:XP_005792202.1 hypothetical protein EMIHUDRAFT_454384 [Emiliania huxleyi CCMP1516]
MRAPGSCVWFELELAASYLRTGDYGRALKNFAHVEQHFADIGEDQFDFHTYCVRKMTLREYVKMVRFEDTLHGHAFYALASVEAPLAKARAGGAAAGYMRTLLLHAPAELRVQALSLGAADAQVHRSAARFLHLYRAGGAALAPAALDDLDAIKEKVADRTGWRERRAALLLAVGRHGEAGEEYLALLKRNPEHFGWHAGLQAAAHPLAATLQSGDPDRAVVASGQEMRSRPQAATLQTATPTERWLSAEVTAEAEATLAALYSKLQKAYPKSQACMRLPPACMRLPLDFTRSPPAFAAALDAYARSYVRKGVPSLFADLKPLCAEGAWSRVLFGEVVAGWVGALEATGAFPDTCEKEPPSTLMWARARVYKHAGHASAAARWMEEARKMDLADRCVWFELELAASYLRTGDYGRALKNFAHVEQHFADIGEDQFDFHTYCVRKMTLREYVKMVRFEDTLHGHAFYVTAACGIIDTYLRTRDCIVDTYLRIALASVEAPLAKARAGGAAAGYMRTLLLHAPAELRVQVLACQLAMARSKPLLALRALRKALSLGAADAQVHRSAARFLHLYRAGGAALAPAVATVVERHSAQILAAAGLPTGATAEAYNDAFLARAGGGAAAAAVAHAEVRALVAPAQAAAAREALASLDLQQASLAVCKEALALLEPGGALADAAAAAAFRQKAVARFPHAPAFGGGSGDEPPPPPSGE